MSHEDSELREIDLTWTPDEIREFCEQQENWILELDESMTSAELEALYQRQLSVERPYLGLIGEIAAHKNTPPAVLEDCASRFAASPEVMSSLALSPGASDALLDRLSTYGDTTVQEHALQSLRARGIR